MVNKHQLAQKSDLFLKQIVDAQVDLYLEEDSYYQKLASPLKSADQLKQEHREHIQSTLLMKEFRDSLSHAISLIFNELPKTLHPNEFAKVQDEMEHILDFLDEPVPESYEGEPVIFHKLWNISDETLHHIHHFANGLIQRKQYEDAHDVLSFLVTLAPDISRFWSCRALCLQAMNKQDEALQVLQVAKILAPDDPVPMIYSCNGYLHLKDKKKATEELKMLESCLDAHPESKAAWQPIQKSLKDFVRRL